MKKLVSLFLCALMVVSLVPMAALAAPTKISMIVSLPPEYKEDNPVLTEIEKLADVDLELIIPPSTSFADSRNMQLSSGDLPDVVMFENIDDKQYRAAVEEGMLIDLTPYLATAENIKKYTTDVAMQYVTTDDGKIMGIPRSSLNRGDGFEIRKDWMDKLGITEVPADVEGFVQMLYQFAKEDPDGNGIADTYAWSGNENSYQLVQYFARAYGADFGWQENAEGNIYHTRYAGDGFKKGLEIVRQLMADGVIDPELLVNKNERDKFLNGKHAIHGEYVGWMPRDRDALKANIPAAELDYAYPPAYMDTGKPQVPNSTVTGVWWFYGITAACKDPQKVVDFFDWCLSDDGWPLLVNGIEGVHYNVENGEKVYTEAFNDYNTWRNYFAFLRRPDIDFYVSKALAPADAALVREKLEYATTVNVLEKHAGHRVPTQDDLDKADWKTKETKAILDIIYGEQPVDAWDTFIADYRAAGFDKVEQEMNDWYQAVVKGK